MSSEAAGPLEVETELLRIRRRLNLRTVQTGLYAVGSISILAALALSTPGLRNATSEPLPTLWGGVFVLVSSMVAAGYFLYRRWMSLADAARLADRTAALDDRLDTLVSVKLNENSESRRFWPILAKQALDLSPRWAAHIVAPRRVPRSAYAFLAACSLLILSALWDQGRPPFASPIGRSSGGAEPQPAPADGPARGHARAQDATGSRSEGEGSSRPLPSAEGATIADTGAAPPDRAPDDEGGAAFDAASETAGGGAPQPSADSVADRRSLAARTDATTQESSLSRAEGAPRPAPTDEQLANSPALAGGGAPENVARGAATEKDGAGRPPRQAGQGPQAAGPEAKGWAASGGTRGGSGPQGLFASPPGPAPRDAEGKSFPLNLTRPHAGAPGQSESAQNASAVSDTSVRPPGNLRPADMAGVWERKTDSPLHRAEISPSHEALLRRMFLVRE